VRVTAVLALFGMLVCPAGVGAVHNRAYPWISDYRKHHTVRERIPAPYPYVRIPVRSGSLQEWLRNFPLRDYGAEVRLHDGRHSATEAEWVVLDIECGRSGFQRGTALPIRLWSEYLWSTGKFWAIEFRLRDGRRVDFNLWGTGLRIVRVGDGLRFRDCGEKDFSYGSFRKYLDLFFRLRCAGLMSVSVRRLPAAEEPEIGDFIYSGDRKGHAPLIMDKAVHAATGEEIYLLDQGGDPARDFHIVRNERERELNPWYTLGKDLYTPQCVMDGTMVYRPF